MNFWKATGRVAEQKGTSARIEVLSYKKNGKNITSPGEIKQNFPPHGYVFAPGFFEQDDDYPIDTLIEFTTSPVLSYKGGNADSIRMDVARGCKAVGFRVFHMTKEIFVNEFSINQPILKNYIHDDLSHFYLRNNGFYYGPFKTANSDVIPKVGTSVNKYQYDFKEYACGAKYYILFEPSAVVTRIDCMTPNQLANFFRDQVRNQAVNLDINLIKKTFDTLQLDELDKARISRLFKTIEHFEITKNEFKELAAASEKLKMCYQKALDQAVDELKADVIEPLNAQKKQLTAEIESLLQKKQQLFKDNEAYSKSLGIVKKELQDISDNKERLIQDIKIHSLIEQARGVVQARLSTYEERTFLGSGAPFSSLEAFIKLVNNTIETRENGTSMYAYSVIYQFRDARCFYTENIQAILQIARLSNNCKVLIQQVEPDWLKFESLYENGLRQIWQSAHENPEIIHFLILEDLNMASIECYGKPLLDILSGVRTQLPGPRTGWPKNLWIFGIPLLQAEGHQFGLPLIKSTFKGWGYFPRVAPLEIIQREASDRVLQVDTLINHDLKVPSLSHEYFSEL